MKKFLLPVLMLSGMALSAQQIQRCATHEHLQDQIAADPNMQQRMAAEEAQIQQFVAANPNGYSPRATVIIPVVVHVVYQNATENINDTRIHEQIQVLNDDYRKQNADAVNVPSAWQNVAADCEIQFCLAAQDPQGNWTSGINRVSTTVSTFNTNDNVKFTSSGGADAWDRSKYLNLWVCDLGSQLLGYAQFPAGPASTDGVVLHYRYTGKTGATAPYNKGRTATHEVGHWLNLRHIWGDDGGTCSGSDGVSDTPNQGGENYGCFTVGNVLTDNCAASAPGVMWMNYMDYTDDACMYMFTTGQKTRMQAVLNGSRVSLKTSIGCVLGVEENNLAGALKVYPTPSNGMVTLDFGHLHLNNVDVTVFNMVGEKVRMIHMEALQENLMYIDLTGEAAGLYFVEVRSGQDKATKRIIIQ